MQKKFDLPSRYVPLVVMMCIALALGGPLLMTCSRDDNKRAICVRSIIAFEASHSKLTDADRADLMAAMQVCASKGELK